MYILVFLFVPQKADVGCNLPQYIGAQEGGSFDRLGFRQPVPKRRRNEDALSSSAGASSSGAALLRPKHSFRPAMPRPVFGGPKAKAEQKVSLSPLSTADPPPPPPDGMHPALWNWGGPGTDPRGPTGLTPRLEQNPVAVPAGLEVAEPQPQPPAADDDMTELDRICDRLSRVAPGGSPLFELD